MSFGHEEGGRLSAEEMAAFSRIAGWLADAFWDVPSPQMVSGFPAEDLRTLSSRFQSADRVMTCMEELSGIDEGVLKEMRVEFTSLLCSNHKDAPFPYESVYSTQERLLMRSSRDDVVAQYEAAGFRPLQESGHEPEDHLSIQLRFLAALLAAEAGVQGELVSIFPEEARETRKRFVAEHMKGWIPRFAKEVEARAQLPLYPALARLAVDVTDSMT
ncbi:MAG: molecular chaperone TorD family protein [Coriobacteriales bacterium]